MRYPGVIYLGKFFLPLVSCLVVFEKKSFLAFYCLASGFETDRSLRICVQVRFCTSSCKISILLNKI